MKPTPRTSPAKSPSKSTNGHATRPAPTAHAYSPTAEDVAVRAYMNYQNSGEADGQDVEHWLAAEAAICEEQRLAQTT